MEITCPCCKAKFEIAILDKDIQQESETSIQELETKYKEALKERDKNVSTS